MKKLIQVSFLLIALYACSENKTAYKAAKRHCELNIKKTYNVLSYVEEYTFSGGGVINIVFKLNDNEINELVEACVSRNFKNISINNLASDGFISKNPAYGINLYNRDIRKIAKGKGFYQLKSKDIRNLDFSITVLDVTNKELIIYVNIP